MEPSIGTVTDNSGSVANASVDVTNIATMWQSIRKRRPPATSPSHTLRLELTA